MPREQVEWFKKESVHDSDKIHAQQSCTYYSVVNVNKNNYPFLSSYEQEQTWTLTRTISNNHKRYQSSIDNIHLTIPTPLLSKAKHVDYENIKIPKTQSNVNLLPTSSLQKYTSTSAIHQQDKPISIKTIKNDVNVKKSRSLSRAMRVIHSNGEFIVRI